MPVILSSDAAGRFVVMTVTDPYTIDEWRSTMLAMLEHPIYLVRRAVLIDRRQCAPASSSFVSQMTQFFAEAEHKRALKGSHSAILVRDDAGFGMGRMTELQAQMDNPEMSIRTFRRDADAERWLSEQSDAS